MRLRAIAASSALLALPLLAASPARADFTSARQLVEQCRSNREQLVFACTGYITGVADTLLDLQNAGGNGGRRFCLPQNVTRNQVRDAVLRDVLADRANAELSAATAVSKALFGRFPCP